MVVTVERTHWGHCGHIAGYFMKELLMSGSNTWWTHCEGNCERTQGFHSKSTQWLPWWAHCKSDQHVIPGHTLIKAEDTL